MNNLQRDIIRKHQKTLPVNVVDLAKELNLRIYSTQEWGDNVSGMLQKREDQYAIYVNAYHPLTRQRFTIAHEIAHYLLHRDHIGDGVADDSLYRSGLSNLVEAQANSLAADILMPQDKVDELWKDPDVFLGDMAQIFHVSEQAMAIRLGVPN